MRLFVAIYPPKSYLDYIRDLLRKLDKEKRNIRPSEMDQIHFTVRFIGSHVSVSTKQKLAKELLRHAGNFPKPEIAVDGFSLGFPRQHHPSVMFLTIKENDDLNDLINDVHHAVRTVGSKDTILWKEKDTRDYHLSVARLKPAAVTNSSIRRVQDLIAQADIEYPEPFIASEMYLVQSTVTPQGPIYKKLERITL